MKRVGMVAYATEQGLGRQAKSFIDNGLIQEVLVQRHSSYHNHQEWYPNAVKNFDELLEKSDTIYFMETPFDWKYILKARENNVKTIFIVHYECTRNPMPYWPDVIVCPSDLDFDYFKEYCTQSQDMV